MSYFCGVSLAISYLSSHGGRLNVFDYTILLLPRCHPVRRRLDAHVHPVVLRVYHITLLCIVRISDGKRKHNLQPRSACKLVLKLGAIHVIVFWTAGV